MRYLKKKKHNTKTHIKKKKPSTFNQSYKKEQKFPQRERERERESTYSFV